MKNPIRVGMAGLCHLLCLYTLSQPVRQTLPVKPLLFSRLPERTVITSPLLDQLFRNEPSQHVRIPLGTSSYIEGIITDKTVRNPTVTSLTIQCTNYDGALLTLSRITGVHAPDTYIGRVVNIRYGDVLLLTKQNDQYLLTKQKQSLVVVE